MIPCSSLCWRPYRDDRRRLHASHAPVILAIRAASLLSARELWRLLVLISSPSSRPRQAKPELERAATAAGVDSDHPSPSRLDPVRLNLHHCTPHPRRPSLSPFGPSLGRIKPRSGRPLLFSAGTPPSSSSSPSRPPFVRFGRMVSFPEAFSSSPSSFPSPSSAAAGGTPPRAPWRHYARRGSPLRGLARRRLAPGGRLGP